MTTEQYAAEQATGCRQRGALVFYNDDGHEVTIEQAADLFWEHEPVIVPAAGAGSYRPILMDFGCEDIEVLDWTSSAGDWVFAIKDGDTWRVVFQANRYPHCGFRYRLSDTYFAQSFEGLCDLMNSL